MAKNDVIKIDGIVEDALPNTEFIVRFENGHKIRANI